HGQLLPQTLEVAGNRRHGQRAVTAPEGDRAFMARERAMDRDRIPALGVTDVVDRDVVVLTPEKRHRIEPLATPKDVPRRDLALALRHDPVLDADAIARMRIRPPRDIARGKHAGG